MQERVTGREWGVIELAGAAITIGKQTLVPDETKAYAEFRLAHGFTKSSRVVTAYGTALHPGTVANSAASLNHQVFNLGHMMRSYDTSKDRDQIRRDYMLGTVVGVEYPPSPSGMQWTVAVEGAPAIRGAAVIHKQAERVPAVLGEHLGGRHKWTVSIEVDYLLPESGFIVGREKAEGGGAPRSAVSKLLDATTPDEFKSLSLGYISYDQAPEELQNTYSVKDRRVTGAWEGLPVTLLKGGVNGQVHFMGVGLVRYGAEREAEVQQILATDPDRLTEEGWDELLGYFRKIAGAD